MSDEQLKVWAAFATAGVSLVVALVSAIASVANQRRLQKLQYEFDERRAEKDAARDYRYEALKRLYQEFEPARFHLLESCNAARAFIREIAQRFALGDQVEDGSLPKGNYFKLACIYHLLLPAACFRIMQHRLTWVDLEASRTAMLQYLLAKYCYASLVRDRDIAVAANLPYTPYVKGWRDLRSHAPQRYRRQGFAPGRLENALAALYREDPKGRFLVRGFGEFEDSMKNIDDQDVSSPLGAAADLFADFDPRTRPVLWRILILQFVLYGLLDCVARKKIETLHDLAGEIPALQAQARSLGITGQETEDVFSFITKDLLQSLRDVFHPRSDEVTESAIAF